MKKASKDRDSTHWVNEDLTVVCHEECAAALQRELRDATRILERSLAEAVREGERLREAVHNRCRQMEATEEVLAQVKNDNARLWEALCTIFVATDQDERDRAFDVAEKIVREGR